MADHSDPARDRHGWASLAHRLGATAKRHLSPYQRALANPTLANISDCLSTLTTDLTVLGLGLLLLCPPAATACLAAATVLAVAQLAVDATRRHHGEPADQRRSQGDRDRWLRGGDSDLLLTGRSAHSIGLVIRRGTTRPLEACGIRLVLRRSSAMNDLNYRIHTAMVTL